jgi:hypothetical protein
MGRRVRAARNPGRGAGSFSVTDWESVLVEKFVEVTCNQGIDSTRFAKPAPRPGL